MPLVFKPISILSNHNLSWRSLEFNSASGLLAWKDTHLPAGKKNLDYMPESIAEQAKGILSDYNAFAFMDHDLFDDGVGIDPKPVSQILNERGDQPDFADDTYERGWISPSGNFTGCLEGHHMGLLHYTIGITPFQSKEEGWIMVQPEIFIQRDMSKPITLAQSKTLEKIGFKSDFRNLADIPEHKTGNIKANGKCSILDISHAPVPLETGKAREIFADAKGQMTLLFNRDLDRIFKSANQNRFSGMSSKQVTRITNLSLMGTLVKEKAWDAAIK